MNRNMLVACDVNNPLTGPRGAAYVFGPQKGATPDQVVEFDAALRAYYAGQFTTQAKAAEQEQRLNEDQRRPGPGSRY